MERSLHRFVRLLRLRGVRVSVTEAHDAMRATHAKAYAPGTKDEDGDLKRRHQAGERVDAIAAGLGRKPGAIRSRLKKLGLI